MLDLNKDNIICVRVHKGIISNAAPQKNDVVGNKLLNSLLHYFRN